MSRKVSPVPPSGQPNKQWFDATVATINDAYAGICTTATRPTNAYVGQHLFDVTIGQPIWLKSTNPQVWVNGVGTTV